ncbi:hypothetical protein GGI06_004021, partial [Coemansia sp. S85]
MATDGLNSDYTPMSIDTDIPSPEKTVPVASGREVQPLEEAATSAEALQGQQPQIAHTLVDLEPQYSEPQQPANHLAQAVAVPDNALTEKQDTAEIEQADPLASYTSGHQPIADASAADLDEPSPKRIRKLSPPVEDIAVPAHPECVTSLSLSESASAHVPAPVVAPTLEPVLPPPTTAAPVDAPASVVEATRAPAPVPAPITTQPFSVAAPVVRDGTQTPTAYSAFDEPSGESLLTKEQHKYCTAMVRALKKHRDAGPFLKPVDIVALNIPDYPTIVKTPMDLSTIERKLKARQYVDTQAFIDDMRLMINNCYMYNGRESVVGNMAANIEVMFDSQAKKMPTGIDTALAEHNRREYESGSRTPGSVARPKRDAHPPPSRDMPNLQRKKSRTADPQMRFCLNI